MGAAQVTTVSTNIDPSPNTRSPVLMSSQGLSWANGGGRPLTVLRYLLLLLWTALLFIGFILSIEMVQSPYQASLLRYTSKLWFGDHTISCY